MKLLFFNAKTGKLQVFYVKNQESNTTEDKMYYECTLDTILRRYSFTSSTLRFNEFESSTYADRVNESLNKLPDEKPTYPEGNLFKGNDSYDIIT